MNVPRPLSPGSLPALSVRASIAAGFPSPCADHSVKRIDLNEHLFLNPNASYLFRVSGDSMVEAGIFDGDTLIVDRSEEHTSELQSLMRISYAVFCLKKTKNHTQL